MSSQTPHRTDEIVYHLDDEDRFIRLSPNWSRFARDNDGSELADPERVLGRRIWEFVDGLTVRSLYRMFFDRVRGDGEPIRVPLRCDGPTIRRMLELEISRPAPGTLTLRSQTLWTQTRPAVSLLDRRAERQASIVTICSFCLKLLCGKQWLEAEQAVAAMDLFGETPPPELSHGVCPDCLPAFFTRLGLPPDTILPDDSTPAP